MTKRPVLKDILRTLDFESLWFHRCRVDDNKDLRFTRGSDAKLILCRNVNKSDIKLRLGFWEVGLGREPVRVQMYELLQTTEEFLGVKWRKVQML